MCTMVPAVYLSQIPHHYYMIKMVKLHWRTSCQDGTTSNGSLLWHLWNWPDRKYFFIPEPRPSLTA